MALRPPRFVRRILASFRWRSRDRDMEREMAFHVDSLTRDYARGGLSDADAQHAARRQFGNLTRLKERGHDERTMRGAEEVARDVRHAARGLWRNPGFSLAVILTLALPGLDGCEVARQLHAAKNGKALPLLIALTGFGRDEDLARTRLAGFDHHVIKPADPQELIRLIRAPRPTMT